MTKEILYSFSSSIEAGISIRGLKKLQNLPVFLFESSLWIIFMTDRIYLSLFFNKKQKILFSNMAAKCLGPIRTVRIRKISKKVSNP